MYLSTWSLRLFGEAVVPLECGVLLEGMAGWEVGLVGDCPASLLAQVSCFGIHRDVSKQPYPPVATVDSTMTSLPNVCPFKPWANRNPSSMSCLSGDVTGMAGEAGKTREGRMRGSSVITPRGGGQRQTTHG